MWDAIQNLRSVDLEVREQLNPPNDWVIGRLVARSGVNGALWRGAQPRGRIEYADVVSGAELVDMLGLLGLHARPVRFARTPFAALAA